METDLPIGKWELSYEQPTTRADNTPLQEGDIWLEMSYTSLIAFNAVKRDSIKVKIVRGRQYIGSEWVTKTISGYIDNRWIDDTFYLFSAELKVNRGEWQYGGHTLGSYAGHHQGVGGSMSVYETQISISASYLSTTNSAGFFYGYNDTPIDVTNFNRLKITVSSAEADVYNSDYVTVGLRKTKEVNSSMDKGFSIETTSSPRAFIFDISDLTGIYYFAFSLANYKRGDRHTSVNITGINLEHGE